MLKNCTKNLFCLLYFAFFAVLLSKCRCLICFGALAMDIDVRRNGIAAAECLAEKYIHECYRRCFVCRFHKFVI